MKWSGLLRLVGICPHAHDIRERDAGGVLWLVCESCGRRVEAIKRSDAERASMQQRFAAPRRLRGRRVMPPALRWRRAR